MTTKSVLVQEFWKSVATTKAALLNAQSAEQRNIQDRSDAAKGRTSCLLLNIPLGDADFTVFGPEPVEYRLPEYAVALRVLEELEQRKEAVGCALQEQQFFAFGDLVPEKPTLLKIERLLSEKPFVPIVQTLALLRKCGFRVTVFLGDEHSFSWNVNLLVPGQDRAEDQWVVAVCEDMEGAQSSEAALREHMVRMPENLEFEEKLGYARCFVAR